ncbi:hypothetical protein CROQUDRAFT_652572 [Cronartium quercuum f. sp. fusiforme G11]|uniref:Uncharacterized protein n=1 Tax=Cronartium quercuum f. sp. fusiforme G11 TaxID=708437 RepID=A0A9P6NQ58_9BASI|nr:hypothetical protein CROQUDRAFT_652572 [Cronartium quercuum f. sp. fusiforme G11]
MPSGSLCPNCQKTLVRCKSLRQTDPESYGREYLACRTCPSGKWYMDDPNRPLPCPAKKRNIWHKLGSWGAPTLPDGLNHTATYIFPPAHDYPQVVFPVSGSLKPCFVTSNRLSTPVDIPQPSSRSVPASPKPPPSPPLENLDELSSPPPPPAPSIPEIAPEPIREPTPELVPPEPIPEKVVDHQPQVLQHQHESEPVFESGPTLEEIINEDEDRKRYELLMKIANSPAPPPSVHSADHQQDGLSQRSDPPLLDHLSREPSPIPERILTPAPSISYHEQPCSPARSASHHESERPMTPIEQVLGREEEHRLREKLIKIVQTPRPATPLFDPSPPVHQVSYTPLPTHTPVDPKLGPDQAQEEVEIADYAERIARRLDEAILKSPFIKARECLYTPKVSHPPTPKPIHSSTPKASDSSTPKPIHSSTPKLSHLPTPKVGSERSTPRASSASISYTPRSRHSDGLVEVENVRMIGSFTNSPRRSTTCHFSTLPDPPLHFCGSKSSDKIEKGKGHHQSFGLVGNESPLFS